MCGGGDRRAIRWTQTSCQFDIERSDPTTRQSEMRLIRSLCLAAVVVTTGCAAIHREPAPEAALNTTRPVGFQSIVRYANSYSNGDPRVIGARFSETLQRHRANSLDGPLNILALSGGGAGGAFGAGALIGLSRRGERPQFDIVTGVSAGALIAPLAFLGPAWDAQLADAFSGARTEHLLDSRGIGALFHPGIYRSEPLVELVDRFVTDELIQAVAQQAAQGRLLLVATTDLDKEETVIWDMGRIAAHGGETARTLFRDVLVASASIPGVFPPIVIPVEKAGVRYDEMHVDGDVTMPFFAAPVLAYIRPVDASGLTGANIYVLVNGQLGGIPDTTPVDTVSIISRSYSATLTHLARASILLTSEFARKYDMRFRFSSIPNDYAFRGPLDFERSSMQALFNYGADCAQDGRLWTTVEQAITRNLGMIPVGFDRQRASDERNAPSCPLDAAPEPYQNTAQLR
jgi:predicted acylesterase/phospholipase RssA